MIEIKPTRKRNGGYKLSMVYNNRRLISNHSDIIELRIKDIRVKLDILSNGYIRILSDDGNFENVGYIGSLSCDFKLIEKQRG